MERLDRLVFSGSLSYLHRQYSYLFKSPHWKVIKIKEWSDGKYTYVFERRSEN